MSPKEKPGSLLLLGTAKGVWPGLPLLYAIARLQAPRRAIYLHVGPLKASAELLLDTRAFEKPASERWPCLLGRRVEALLMQHEVETAAQMTRRSMA